MARGGGYRGGDRGDRRRGGGLLLAASERLYGALLALYPEAFRRRYASEMRRDFRDLSREALEEGGGAELAKAWGAAFSDLALTAFEERGTVLSRNAILPVDPRIAARAMAAVVLVAVTVTAASLAETPRYEASAKVLVGQSQGDDQGSNLGGDVQGLQDLTVTMTETVETRPVAEAVIRRLDLSVAPNDFLQNLRVEQLPSTQIIEVSYGGASPEGAQRVANAVGEEFSGLVSGLNDDVYAVTATVVEPAPVPKEPASPNPLRDGLLALVSGLLLFVGLAFALPRVAASGVGRAARQATRAVASQTAIGSWERLDGASATEGAKEKELLGALGRRGGLTAAGAALETSLTVEEADRMLSALAAKGHLEVSVARGRLLYSLWEGDGPP